MRRGLGVSPLGVHLGRQKRQKPEQEELRARAARASPAMAQEHKPSGFGDATRLGPGGHERQVSESRDVVASPGRAAGLACKQLGWISSQH